MAAFAVTFAPVHASDFQGNLASGQSSLSQSRNHFPAERRVGGYARAEPRIQNDPHENVEILLVEDNPADVRMFQTLISGPLHITVAKNGAEALDRLFQRGQFEESVRPDIVVLDLNLPLLNGNEVLNAMKANSRLRSIPAIIFSVSDHPDDIQKAYDFGASAYVIKPSELKDAERILSAFADFWIRGTVYPGLQRCPTESDDVHRPAQARR